MRDPYRQLAIAILARACKDVLKGNAHAEEARAFLASEGAAFLADELGFVPDRVRAFAESEELPQLPKGLVSFRGSLRRQRAA